jgi:hypothetical protein
MGEGLAPEPGSVVASRVMAIGHPVKTQFGMAMRSPPWAAREQSARVFISLSLRNA